jgi:hypothetical protein
MNSFRNHRLRDHALPMSTAWLLNDIAEAKGKQELYTRQSPQVLKALREMALVQSVESSNCDMIRLLLRDLKSAERVECRGRGPGAKWRKRVIPSREGNKEGNNPIH